VGAASAIGGRLTDTTKKTTAREQVRKVMGGIPGRFGSTSAPHRRSMSGAEALAPERVVGLLFDGRGFEPPAGPWGRVGNGVAEADMVAVTDGAVTGAGNTDTSSVALTKGAGIDGVADGLGKAGVDATGDTPGSLDEPNVGRKRRNPPTVIVATAAATGPRIRATGTF